MSGLKVNLSKSFIISIGEIPNIHHLASFFDCGVCAFLSTYLGLSLRHLLRAEAI